MVGIYIHVPFCRNKCPYCHFFTVPYKEDLEKKYIKALLYEANEFDEENDTVYIGGGTPSVLSCNSLEKIASRFLHNRVKEASIEINPEDDVDFRFLKRLGFNRLSIAAISFSGGVLSYLGRRHSVKDVMKRIEEARTAGFEDINLDVLYGVPGHGLKETLEDLKMAVKLEPTHISYYLLEIPGFFPLKGEKIYDEETLERLYYNGRDFLESTGFFQYEVSNFARHGYRSLHNLKYWKFEPYIGLGPGAASLYGRRRWENKRSLMAYIGAWKRRERIPRQIFDLSEDEFFKEKIMMGLRLVEGVKFSPQEREKTSKFIERAKKMQEVVSVSEDSIKIKRDKFFVMNSIILEIIG